MHIGETIMSVRRQRTPAHYEAIKQYDACALTDVNAASKPPATRPIQQNLQPETDNRRIR